jgi:PKD repeat protein
MNIRARHISRFVKVMKPRTPMPRIRRRGFRLREATWGRAALPACVVAALVFGIAPAAEAGANVVPNPGFEQGGCGGSTPIICGWDGGPMSQDPSNPHSGNASVHLECEAIDCVFDSDTGWVHTAAVATSCIAMSAGTHAASFWFRDVVGTQVSLDAEFYMGTDCIDYNRLGSDSLAQPAPGGGGWQQVTGSLHGPTYTRSARVSLSVGGWCEEAYSCPLLAANFDDVNIDDVGDPAPTVSSFTPAGGWERTRVWIYGFDFVGATSVTFNGVPAEFSVQSDRWIDTNVPAGATDGPISVTTANGTGWSSSSFTLVPPPTVSSFTPSGGGFGTVVDIRGANFTGAIEVVFNTRPAAFTVDSDSEIHASVPDGAKTGQISVTTVSGTGRSSSLFVVPTPTISSFTPSSGPPGTTVDILGTNFTEATIVTFHSTRADFSVLSDTEIRATVPAGATTGWISVATTAGSVLTSSSFTVTGVPPVITYFAPNSGSAGTTVDMLGSAFTGATSVTFNGMAADFTVDSDTELHATVPAGAVSGRIQVATPVGTAATSSSFTVITDTTPPDTTITSGPPGTTASSSATFQFGATEASTFECSLDATAFAACSSPTTYTALADGSYTFRVRATDAAGNTDPTPAQQTWTVRHNAPPTARFTVSCTALTCSFDGSGSTDTDGTIQSYSWGFGDGTTATGSHVSHTYPQAGGYVVALTVTDNDGATNTGSTTVTPINLVALGYKLNGQERADLSWSGASWTSFDVYRNGTRIATVQANAYADKINNKGPGTYSYKVCQAGIPVCSNTATVRF